jgi:hypothetical protein
MIEHMKPTKCTVYEIQKPREGQRLQKGEVIATFEVFAETVDGRRAEAKKRAEKYANGGHVGVACLRDGTISVTVRAWR